MIIAKRKSIFEINSGYNKNFGNHDAQLNQIYDAIENLLGEKAAQRKWNERERIGFKK